MISTGQDTDPIVKAVLFATGLHGSEVKSITLKIEASEITLLTVEKYITDPEAEGIATTLTTYELHERVND